MEFRTSRSSRKRLYPPALRPGTAASVALLLSLAMLSTAAAPGHARAGGTAATDSGTAAAWNPVTPPPPDHPATAARLSGAGLNVTVAKEFPQVVSYDLNGRTMDGRAAVLDSFTINGAYSGWR
ncbi:hypothetical protein ACLMNJ_02410 [Streptomyces seoulensis]